MHNDLEEASMIAGAMLNAPHETQSYSRLCFKAPNPSKIVRCSKCNEPFEPSEMRYDFKRRGVYCRWCMKCSVCGGKATGDVRYIESGVAFCQKCYLDKHKC